MELFIGVCLFGVIVCLFLTLLIVNQLIPKKRKRH
jgi:hypothetical protein